MVNVWVNIQDYSFYFKIFLVLSVELDVLCLWLHPCRYHPRQDIGHFHHLKICPRLLLVSSILPLPYFCPRRLVLPGLGFPTNGSRLPFMSGCFCPIREIHPHYRACQWFVPFYWLMFLWRAYANINYPLLGFVHIFLFFL